MCKLVQNLRMFHQGSIAHLAADEIERLRQALADAHGLLISYGKMQRQLHDLMQSAELHFTAFREASKR